MFGDPSEYSLLGLRVIQTLTEVACGPYRWVCVGTASDLAAALGQASDRPVVFFADSPDHRISSVFLESGAPLVVFLNSPHAIAKNLAVSRSLDAISSIRVTTQSLSCLHELAIVPRAYVVSERLDVNNLDKYIRNFARLYEIRLDDSILKEAMHRLIPAMQKDDEIAPARGDLAIESECQTAAMASCLEGFGPLLKKKPINQVYWPREVFLDADRQGMPLSGPLDLTGSARLLLYGPFLHLPRGSWCATVTFEVSQNLSGNSLKIDIYYDGVIGEWKCELPKEGIYVFDLRFEVLDPRHAVQIRFYIMQGAIEGIFDLKHVDLRRVDRNHSN